MRLLVGSKVTLGAHVRQESACIGHSLQFCCWDSVWGVAVLLRFAFCLCTHITALWPARMRTWTAWTHSPTQALAWLWAAGPADSVLHHARRDVSSYSGMSACVLPASQVCLACMA